jgi:signal peptidase II
MSPVPVNSVSSPEAGVVMKLLASTGLRWLWLVAVVIVLDQVSKQLVVNHLVLHEALPLLPSLNLLRAENTGAAFSFLSGASGWQRWFFIALATTISVMLLVWLRRLSMGQRLQGGALALILGGALGNLFDRVLHGYVIDFIDVYYRDWHFPVFNIADSAITVGAILLILDTLLHPTGKSDSTLRG